MTAPSAVSVASSGGERRTLRPDEPQSTLLSHPTRLASGCIAEAPEKIGAQRAPNRAAGVLRQHETLERTSRQWIGRRQKDRRAEWNESRVDSNRTPGQQRHAERPDRTVDRCVERTGERRRNFTEEDV